MAALISSGPQDSHTAQLKMLTKEDFQSGLESGRNEETSIFKVRGVSRGITGRVSFSIIKYF